MSRLSGENLKKMIWFFSYCPLKNLKLTSQVCKCNIAKSVIANDLKPVPADRK